MDASATHASEVSRHPLSDCCCYQPCCGFGNLLFWIGKRDAINKEISDNFNFFAGKSVSVKHSQGQFEAAVLRVYSDETMSVKNLDIDKTSTRSLHELAFILDGEQG